MIITFTANANGWIFLEGRDYLNAIPVDEGAINPELVQNPGWSF